MCRTICAFESVIEIVRLSPPTQQQNKLVSRSSVAWESSSFLWLRHMLGASFMTWIPIRKNQCLQLRSAFDVAVRYFRRLTMMQIRPSEENGIFGAPLLVTEKRISLTINENRIHSLRKSPADQASCDFLSAIVDTARLRVVLKIILQSIVIVNIHDVNAIQEIIDERDFDGPSASEQIFLHCSIAIFRRCFFSCWLSLDVVWRVYVCLIERERMPSTGIKRIVYRERLKCGENIR